MCLRIRFCILIVFCIPSLILFGQNSDFPVLKGPYLGQKPPGSTPKVFAPGIISTEATEGGSPFSVDGRLFLFARAGSANNGILFMEQKDGIWTKPQLASFSAGGHDWDFSLAPDGNTVFVASGRPTREGGSPVQNHRIWVSERTNQGWSESRLLPFPVNSGYHDSYPSVTEDGTLYFFSRRSGGLGDADIYRSKSVDNQYTTVENLNVPINSEYSDLDPFIAPDESYMIFCSTRSGGYGKADLYAAFRQSDDLWTQPVNMGKKVNSSYQEYIPSVTIDGKYFFFTSNKSGNRDIYWVDAKIIEDLKPDELK